MQKMYYHESRLTNFSGIVAMHIGATYFSHFCAALCRGSLPNAAGNYVIRVWLNVMNQFFPETPIPPFSLAAAKACAEGNCAKMHRFAEPAHG